MTLTVEAALLRCAETEGDRVALRRLRAIRLLDPEDDRRHDELDLQRVQRGLERALLAKLESGDWRATAVWNAAHDREAVAPGWWTGAAIDRWTDTATGHGSTLTGVRITPGAVPVVEAPAAPRPAPDSRIREAVAAVYDEHPDDPPNINKLCPLAKAKLGKTGFSASNQQIKRIGEEPQFKARRREPGHRRPR